MLLFLVTKHLLLVTKYLTITGRKKIENIEKIKRRK